MCTYNLLYIHYLRWFRQREQTAHLGSAMSSSQSCCSTFVSLVNQSPWALFSLGRTVRPHQDLYRQDNSIKCPVITIYFQDMPDSTNPGNKWSFAFITMLATDALGKSGRLQPCFSCSGRTTRLVFLVNNAESYLSIVSVR